MSFTLIHDEARRRAVKAVENAPDGSMVTIREGDARTLDQNAKLWPMLNDVSAQVDWYGYKLSKEDWKDIFSASLSAELRTVPNLQGNGFVMLGLKTSKMSKRKFSDLIELIYSFGSEKGVHWSEKATKAYEDYRRAA